MNQFKQRQEIAIDCWEKYLEGDKEALGEIFQEYFQDFVAYGLKIINSEDLVKDCIQELFVYLWDRRLKLPKVNNVKVYLLICLKNDLLQTLKSVRHDKADSNIHHAPIAISVEDFIIEKEQESELAEKVVSCLKKLTDRQREVIYLRFYLNLDFSELSEVMDMNVQSVRNLLFRALRKIRRDIEDGTTQSGGG